MSMMILSQFKAWFLSLKTRKWCSLGFPVVFLCLGGKLGCHGDRLQTDVSTPLQTLPVLAMPKMRAVLALCGTRPSGSTEVFRDTHSPGDSLLFVTFSSDFLEPLSTSIRENKRLEKDKVAFRIRQRKWPSFFFQSCRYWKNSDTKHWPGPLLRFSYH